MLQHMLWIISFFSLWLTIIWLQILFYEEPRKKCWKEFPSVTIAVAAYNEEKAISKTVNSIAESDYPQDKLEVIVVDDGSTDRTADVVNSLISKHPSLRIRLFRKQNGGKATAINVALENATGELFGVVDADSRIEQNSISLVTSHFADEGIGAVISRVKVDSPKKMIERVQRFEYIMSNMIRSLMSRIGTLAMTPGVLSVYRTATLRKLGGFETSRENLSEDLEIAMRLKYYGYKVVMEPESITHTTVPQSIARLWRQRIRWSRGYIYNHWKYRSMFFSRKHRLFGIFQMPINILVIILLMLNISIITYSLFSDTIEFAVRSATIDGYFMSALFDLPTIQEFLLSQNLRIIVPIILITILGIYLIILTHKLFKEKLARNIVPVVAYFLFLPYFMTLNWFSSIFQEIRKTKKKW